jgi:hypothetical protein
MYEEAYAKYLANNHNGVHESYAEMMRKYPLSKIMPKFMWIDALSYLTEKNHDKFKETIKDMLQRYPETDITPVASDIVRQLNQGRRLEGGGSNIRGMLWTTRLSNDTTPQALERTFTPFAEDNDKPQVFILLYPIDSVNSNMLLYEVARHNFNSFQVKDYDIEQMNFGSLGLLVVRGLDDFKEAKNYRTVFEQDQSITIPRQVHYVIISVDNFNLLLNEGRTFEDYFNYLEEKNDKQHSDLEKKELDEAAKKAQEEADKQAAIEREKARIEAEQIEREAAELAKRDAEAKALEEAEEKARLEAEAAEQARLEAEAEAEEKARQEAERKQIKAEDYRNQPTVSSKGRTEMTDKERKAQERAEEEHLKQLEREAKAREKAEAKRQKEIEDSIKKEQKHERKLARIAEIAEQDSIEQAEKEKEKERDFYYRWREDSAKAAYKAAEQAKKDAKKAKEQAKKDKIKERKRLAKEREKERKEKAKERERERKQKAKERKEQAKAREQERKQKMKEREEERKRKADERKQNSKGKSGKNTDKPD